MSPSHPHGAVLLREGHVPTELLALVQGEVSEWRGGRLLGFRQAPALLAPGAALAGQESPVTLLAEGPVVLEPRSPEHPEARAWLAAEVHRLQAERAELVATFDEFWDSPNARLVPGPYRFDPVEATLVLVQGPPGHVAGLLPPGLHPVPGLSDRYLLILGHHLAARTLARPGDRRWPYKEATPLLPCLAEGGLPGAFVPELYPSALLPTLLGRELYGFPKRVARIVADAERYELITEHQRILRARLGPRRDLSPEALVSELLGHLAPWSPRLARRLAARGQAAALRLPVSVYMRDEKLHRRRLQPRTLREDLLVCVPFRFEPLSRPAALDAFELELAPDHPVLAGRALAAWHAHTAFSFGESAVVKDLGRSLRARLRRQP